MFMGLPNFLCIGAQKAGTSWLFNKLQQHPQIWMPPVKELHYFDHLFVPENRRWTEGHIKRSVRQSIKWHCTRLEEINLGHIGYMASLADARIFTEVWYRHCFDRPVAKGKVLGDITPEYCMIPEAGIQYLVKLLGPVKIIYIVRNPFERALSQVRMNAERRGLNGTNVDWLAMVREPDIATRGAYATYVPHWEAAIPKENLLFLPYGRIAKDPTGVMGDIETLIGVNHFAGYKKLDERVHSTKSASVSREAEDYLQDLVSLDSAFIEQRFGAQFAALT
jgi:hypothetical protein